ncbi:MAG: DMT family transporter [Sphaerochaetaceae bacterium]|jgi:DME family drug/metabolite transporter
MNRDKSVSSGALLVSLAGVLWGTHGTIASFLPHALSPYTLSAIRLIIGSIGLYLFVIFTQRRRVFTKRILSNYTPSLIAAVALAFTQTAVYFSIQHAGVTIAATIFIATPPLFSGAYAFFIQKERQTLSWIISAILITIGCVSMALSGDVEVHGSSLLIGSVSAALAGATWTVVGTFLKKLEHEASPLETVVIVMSGASLLLLPLALLTTGEIIISTQFIILSLLLGIVSTSLPFFFFTTGVRHIRTSHAFIYGLSEPITVGILGTLVLKERLTTQGIIGYGFVLLGLLLFSIWEITSEKFSSSSLTTSQ